MVGASYSAATYSATQRIVCVVCQDSIVERLERSPVATQKCHAPAHDRGKERKKERKNTYINTHTQTPITKTKHTKRKYTHI
jgi:hypothetical protein